MKNTRRYLKAIKDQLVYGPVYKRYREFTMVQRNDFIDCLSLTAAFRKIPGCVIECGVWRGGMMAGIAEVMGPERNYFLFDSFEGLPPAKEIDGQSAIDWQKDVHSPTYFDNCRAEMEWAEKAMKRSGVPDYKLVKGWFSDTVPAFELKEQIAVLHLDGDWYDSTMVCLEHFFPKLAKGGLIILDDYYAWDGCSKALHDYLSANKLPEKIVRAYTSGCYLIKH